MEASGVVIRRLPCFSGAGIDAHSSLNKHSFPGVSLDAGARFSGDLWLLCPPAGQYCSRASVKPRKFFYGFSDSYSGFCDNGHVQYYSGSTTTRCGGGKEGKKIKKRLKMLKGLSRDLSTFSEMHFGLDPDHHHGLADQLKGKMISEAADLLLGQLQQLRAEEKELKWKRKEEKAKLKAARTQQEVSLSSSPSSESSSDGECGKVVDMNHLRLKSEALAQGTPNELQPPVIQEAAHSSTVTQAAGNTADLLQPAGNTADLLQPAGTEQAILLTIPSTLVQAGGNMAEERGFEVLCSSPITTDKRCCSSSTESSGGSHVPSRSNINVGDVGCTDGNSLLVTAGRGESAARNKIEVCMGGKCKKSGAASLLEEFQRVVGGGVAAGSIVIGCKCMGKCRDGPNVRVNLGTTDHDDSVRTPPTNPLCIGVGLEDVGFIVTNFIGGKNHKDLGLAASSAAVAAS